jgi:hypothetical protein
MSGYKGPIDRARRGCRRARGPSSGQPLVCRDIADSLARVLSDQR